MSNILKRRLYSLQYDLENASTNFCHIHDRQKKKEFGKYIQRILIKIVDIKHKLQETG